MLVDPYILSGVLSTLIVAVVVLAMKLQMLKCEVKRLLRHRLEQQVNGYARACLVSNMGATPEKMRKAISTKADPHFNMGVLERIEELEK